MLIPSPLVYHKYTSASEMAGREENLHDRWVHAKSSFSFGRMSVSTKEGEKLSGKFSCPD
jgi:hypothetical protein